MLNVLLKPIAHLLPQSNRFQRIWKLAQVDFKKRYYNDRLGLVWALLNPLLRIATYFFIFKYVLARGQENYGVFLFSGLLLWMYFKESTNGGMKVFRQKKYLIESIQFMRIDLFLSQGMSVFFGFMFNTLSFFVFSMIFGVFPTLHTLYLPLIIINVIFVTLGTTLIISILSLRVNDIAHAWDIITLFGMWTAGIFFPAKSILETAPIMLYLHPFIGLIENMRRVSMFGQGLDWNYFTVNMTQGLVLCIVGFILFEKYNHEVLEKL